MSMQGIEYSRRVYYHDTDAGGVVYHGNYFRFCEEARTAIFESLLKMTGVEFSNKYGIAFVISKTEASYKRPVNLDDMVTLKSYIDELGSVRTKYRHEVFVGETLCAEVKIEVASIDAKTFRPAKNPEDLMLVYKESFGL